MLTHGRAEADVQMGSAVTGNQDGFFASLLVIRVRADTIQEDVIERFEPYADRIFAGFNISHMAYAIALSMVDQYGPDITYTKEVEGETVPISCQIDVEFVDKLFKPETGRTFENVFSYVVGLAEKPKQTAAQVAAGMSVGEIAKETIGDEKNSEREQDSE